MRNFDQSETVPLFDREASAAVTFVVLALVIAEIAVWADLLTCCALR